MDTPDRSKIGAAPPSKFDDSPVFNFLSNLSPIQPVKSIDSIHNANTYTLNLASLTSIFSSPHANSPKETKIPSRSPFKDISKQQSSSDNVEENNLHSGVAGVRLSHCTTNAQDNYTITCPGNEAANGPPTAYHSLPCSSTQSLQYDGGSPNHNTTPCYGIKMDDKPSVEYTPVEVIRDENGDENGLERRQVLFSTETSCHENIPHVQEKDERACEWVDFISENDENLLIFDSSAEAACVNEDMKVIENDVDNLQCLQAGHSDDNTIQDPLNPCVDLVAEDGADDASNSLSRTGQNQVDNQQRGIRRRCLVFEKAGVSKGHVYNDSSLNHSRSIPFQAKTVSGGSHVEPATRKFPCALPGIGLHLNTIASTSKERTFSKANMTFGNQFNTPKPLSSFPSTMAGQNNLSNFKDNIRTEVEDIKLTHDEVVHDIVGNTEELSQGSPKKKRRRSENGETDGCKRCNCKKSKCLKLYCECFAAGVYCSEPCSCQECFNKPIHEDTVLATRKQIESRNPLAFAPKVIRSSEAVQEIAKDDDNKTPASARHKRGCNCKKSNCLKRYCECFQGGVGCSISCRCEGCKNAFGSKEDILALVMEAHGEGEEQNNSCEKESKEFGSSQQNADVHIDENLSREGTVLITPFKSCRLSVDLSVYSSAKPPRSSKLSVSDPVGVIGSHGLLKSETLLLDGKLENNVNMIVDDDTLSVLRGATSPSNVVKTASPNSKRISPPHTAIGLSPYRKGSRKLILKSIPSCSLPSNDVSTTENPVGYSNSSFTSSELN